MKEELLEKCGVVGEFCVYVFGEGEEYGEKCGRTESVDGESVEDDTFENLDWNSF